MTTREAEKSAVVLDQQLALRAYFDALLTPPAEAPAAPARAPLPEDASARPCIEHGASGPVSVPAAPLGLESSDPPTVVEPEPQQEAQRESQQQSQQQSQHEPLRDLPVRYDPQAQVPAWGRARFETLTFSVAGLTLAVPLARLSGVAPWEEAVTAVPQQAPWLLGLVRHQDANVQVVDTAQIVLPPNRRNGLAPADERATHLVLIDEGRWGLACDAIGDVLSVDPGDVSWRTARSKRPWLAGTVRARLCAVLDPDALAQGLGAGVVE